MNQKKNQRKNNTKLAFMDLPGSVELCSLSADVKLVCTNSGYKILNNLSARKQVTSSCEYKQKKFGGIGGNFWLANCQAECCGMFRM
mmetsp:Transcript_27840/g.42150  ORF Transcript_27840/g.42150 Transcript_27840/m.42150 type:complete len:87 (-) Transcript_27840:283-543(-)